VTKSASSPQSPSTPRRAALAGVLAAATALSLTGLVAAPAHAAVDAAAPVVIDEVYGGGGNNGATWTHDFVELVNISAADVSLEGWSLQYASSGGAWNASNVMALSGTIPAGGTVLVQQAAGAGGTTALPTPDLIGTLALSSTGGKIALVSDMTALGDPAGPAGDVDSVVDLVGWGPAASDYAGSGPAPATTNATSVSRDANHTNRPDNALDFTAGPPSPVNAKGETAPPTDPDPDPDPEPEPEPELTAIAAIQGTDAASPLLGSSVIARGVVTASYPTGGLNGFVIQTPGTGGALDASHTASEAVFVYAPGTTPPTVGAYVEVAGTVGEFNGLTQISAATTTVLPDVVTAPQPATVAWPATDTERERLESMLVAPQGAYTVSNTYATNQYGEVGLAFGETPLRQPTDAARPGTAEVAAIEADNAARRVTLDDATTTNFLTAANSALTPPYISLTEPVVVGAQVSFTAPVIVDWRNNAWKFNPTAPLTGDGSGTDGVVFESIRTAAPEAVGGDLSVASFNVLNYFTTLGDEDASCQPYRDRFGDGVTVNTGCGQRGAWDSGDFTRQQDKIVAAIEALDADVVGLMEIENSAALGEEADEATATLVAALNAAAGTEKWAYVASSTELPEVSQQDVITNAIIYQPAAVTTVGASRALGDRSGAGDAFSNAREPIAQVFAPADGGDEFLFAVNHFKSKGSATFPEDADQGDGQGAANWSRVRQAEALRDWIASIQGDVDSVVLAGDFNSYGQEDPLQVLYDAGYASAEHAFSLGESSYSFQGLSGSLDHVLLNGAALERATGADVWGINAGESIALEYSRYQYHGTAFHAADPYRSSDHDPVLVGLSATEPPLELTLLGINDFHGRIDANTVKFAGTVEQLRAAASGPTLFLSSGDNIGASLFASAVAQDQPTIDVLNALDLDTTAVGNHEFDRGWADLSGRVTDASEYTQLGANVYVAGSDDPALPEYALFDADGFTVAVIGAVTEETPTLVAPGGITDLEFGDPVAAVNRVAAELTDGDPANGEADVLVALYHEGAGAGTPDNATLEQEVAGGGAFAAIVEDTSPEIDAIFNGHTHKEYAWSAAIPGTDRTRPVVQTSSYGALIGEIVLTIDRETGEVLAHTERNVPRTTTADADLVAQFPRVAAVAGIVADAIAAAAEIGNTAVAEVSADITTAFAGGSYVDGVWTGGTRDDRASESTLGNLVADTLRDSLADLPNGAQIGVTNPGGLRAELWDTQAEFGATAVEGMADGTISFSQANAVLPFNNTMALITLTGAQFTTLLEQQWQRDANGNVPSRPYLQLGLSDNVTYTFDPALPEGSRITSVTIDGEPLDPAAEYRIGTLSFLATGGDNFRVFLEGTGYVDTGLLDYEAWVDHLAEDSPVAPSFARRSAVVTGAPETAAPGAEISFEVSGLNLTSRGAPENTSLQIALGDTVLGEVPVSAGAASVQVTLPADLEPGASALTLTASPSGTVVTVPLVVEESTVASETTLSLNRTKAPYGDTRTVRATARVSADQSVQGGTVEFLVNGEVVAEATTNRNGVARADLSLPDGLDAGGHAVIARFTGTDEVAASESPAVTFTVTQAKSRTSLTALLPLHLNGLLPSTLVAYVDQPGKSTGVVEFREGGANGTVIATVPVRDGLATHTLGRLSRGVHQYTAVFVPADADNVAGSHSGRTAVVVLF